MDAQGEGTGRPPPLMIGLPDSGLAKAPSVSAAQGSATEPSAGSTGLDSSDPTGPVDPVEEKRVSNALIKSELAFKLTFPSYKQGMAALVAGDIRPFSPRDLEWLGLEG